MKTKAKETAKNEDKEAKISMRMSKEESTKWKELGKKNGYPKLSPLIRRALAVVNNNPELLNPTGRSLSPESSKILDSITQSQNIFEQLNETLISLNSRISHLERSQEWVTKKLGASKKELVKIKHTEQDESSEAVFE